MPLVEDQAADRRPHQLGALLAVHGGGHADQDGHVQLQLALVVGQAGLGEAGEGVQDLLGLLPGSVGPAGLIAGGGQQTVGVSIQMWSLSLTVPASTAAAAASTVGQI